MYRFGARARPALSARRRAALALAAGLLPRPLTAEAAEARVEARAGIDAFALHASPGAPVPSGWCIQLASAHPYVGSGLLENALRMRVAAAPLAAVAAWEQRRSTVHRNDAFITVVQLRLRSWHGGLRWRARRLGFEGYVPRWSSEFGVGVGVLRRWGALVANATPHRDRDQPARIDLGGRLPFHRDAALFVQHVREAGLPGRVRGALSLRARALALHVGYDVATRSAATGFEVGNGPTRFLYAVRTHPELGWTHTWMLELGSHRREALSSSY